VAFGLSQGAGSQLGRSRMLRDMAARWNVQTGTMGLDGQLDKIEGSIKKHVGR